MFDIFKETLKAVKEKESFDTPEECLKFIDDNFDCYLKDIVHAEETIFNAKFGSVKMAQEEYSEILTKGIDACDKADEFAEKYTGKRIFNLEKDKNRKYKDFFMKSSQFVSESLASK